MEDANTPKFSKATLSKVFSLAQHDVVERSNQTDRAVLDHREFVARCYVDATIAVLNQMGFEVVAREDLSKK